MTLSIAAQAVLARLEQGPANTIELQAACPTTHAPKGIFDLRAAGYTIVTRRLPNRVAVYTLEPGAPVAAGHPARGSEDKHEANPAATRVPVFGDVQLIREMRR